MRDACCNFPLWLLNALLFFTCGLSSNHISASFVQQSSSSFTRTHLRIEKQTNHPHRLDQRRHKLPSSSSSSPSFLFSQKSSSSTTTTLPPIPEEWRGEILNALSNIIDPDLNRDIVTLNFIKNLTLDPTLRLISFDLELTTPACPVKDEFLSQARSLILSLPWTLDTAITLTAQPSISNAGAPSGLSQVSSIIAVSSCKGGVGKSTTAVNLAYALQSQGATVGIFDADLYGPSLPTMITPDNDVVRFVGRQIAPLSRNGVKLMSFGYVNDGSAVMRGPMITQLLDQLTSVTNWGVLDYLILDMPPGTGDVQLTLSQRLNITAAVIVTTPQELSFVDVVRGVEMFQEVNVPCVAVVENMAFMEVDETMSGGGGVSVDKEVLKERFEEVLSSSTTLRKDNDDDDEMTMSSLTDALVRIVEEQQQQQTSSKEQLRIFGPGHQQRLSKQWGIEHTYSVPLQPTLSANGDSGTPYILQNPDSDISQTYRDLASAVVMEVAKIKFSPSQFSVSYDEDKHLLTVVDDKKTDDGETTTTATLSTADLRRECRCAACVEELTGRQILQRDDVKETIKPVTMSPCGNYALSVDWDDGHRSLYPYKQIRGLLGDLAAKAEMANDDEEKGESVVTEEEKETVASSSSS